MNLELTLDDLATLAESVDLECKAARPIPCAGAVGRGSDTQSTMG